MRRCGRRAEPRRRVPPDAAARDASGGTRIRARGATERVNAARADTACSAAHSSARKSRHKCAGQ
eukprot:5523874-Pleurochrysis_carterae.AAC.1